MAAAMASAIPVPPGNAVHHLLPGVSPACMPRFRMHHRVDIKWSITVRYELGCAQV